MYKKHNQILTVLLSFFLCFSNLLPVTAQDTEEGTEPEQAETVTAEEQESEETEVPETAEPEETAEEETDPIPEETAAPEPSAEPTEEPQPTETPEPAETTDPEETIVPEETAEPTETELPEEETREEITPSPDSPEEDPQNAGEETDDSELTAAEEDDKESEEFAEYGDYTYTSTSLGVTITKYNGSDSNVVIPSEINGKPVICIGREAFQRCYSLQSVTIPEGVTLIDQSAFQRCLYLTQVTLPESLKTIGYYAFESCESLYSITIPEGVTKFNSGAFRYCKNLSFINLPKGLTSFGDSTFEYCDMLTNAGPIGSGANIEFGWEESIPKSVFNWCYNLHKITIPEGITTIEADAFYGCSGLTTIELPDSLTTIGNWAFYQSGIREINIPQNVTGIGEHVFTSCDKLETITVDSDNTVYDSRNNCNAIIETENNNLIAGCQNTVIPDSVEIINNYAFQDCINLTDIVIPDSVSRIGDAAFKGCAKLSNIHMPAYMVSIGRAAFEDCVVLSEIELPGGISSVESSLFSGCTNLINIALPESILRINSYAFYKCNRLKDIHYEGSKDQWNRIIIDENNDAISNATLHYLGRQTLFTLGRDNNSFVHSFSGVFGRFDPWSFDYIRNARIFKMDNLYWKAVQSLNPGGLASYIQKKLYDSNAMFVDKDDTFGGVCYGTSMTMLQIFDGLYSIKDISDSNSTVYHDLTPSEDKKLQNYLVYYQFSQHFPEYEIEDLLKIEGAGLYTEDLSEKIDTSEELREVLKDLANYELKGVGELVYYSTDGTNEICHAILVTDKVFNVSDNRYEFTLYDLNTVDKNGLGLFGKMTISGDFSRCSFTDIYGSELLNDNSTIKCLCIIGKAAFVELIESTEAALNRAGKKPSGKSVSSGMNALYGDGSNSTYIEYDADTSFALDFGSDMWLSYSNNQFTGNVPIIGLKSDFDPVHDESGNSRKHATIEIDGYSAATITPSTNRIDITFYSEKGLLSVEGEGIENASISFDEGIHLNGSEYSFKSYITSDIYAGNDLLMNSMTGTAEGHTYIHVKDGTIVAENDTAIQPDLSVAFIGNSRHFKEFDETSGETIIELNDHHFAQDEFCVFFNTGIENSEIANQYVAAGTSVIKPEDPEREGYVFKGWYTSSIYQDDETYWDFETDKVYDNTTLYAGYANVENSIYISGLQSNYQYSGTAVKPQIEVYDSGVLLKNKMDYTVTYKNTTKAYKVVDPDNPTPTDKKKAPQIIIESNKKGNYAGTKTVYFSIDPVDLYDDGITIDELSVQATGKTLSPVPVVYFNGKKLKNKTDYTVEYEPWDRISNGEVTVKITGKGNFTGTREVNVHVASKDLVSVAKLSVSSKPISYADLTGDPVNDLFGRITVKNGKKTVLSREDEDYYMLDVPEDYAHVGTVSFVIQGNEERGYYGKRTVTVKITGISLTNKKIKPALLSYPYTGEEIEIPAETSVLTYNGAPLTEGTDYEIVSYEKNTNAGKATVTVKGLYNYTGTRKITFTITPDTSSKESLVNVEEAYYSKGGSKPKVTVEGLTEGTDFTVKYSNNTKANTEGTAVISFKGNYKGTPSVTRTFYIQPKDISEVTVTAKDMIYTTKAGKYKSTPVLTDTDGKKLKAGTDYEKVYTYTDEYGQALSEPVPAGTVVRVTVTGKGNYTGETYTEYRIVDTGKDISKMSFKIANKEYTGRPVTIDESDITSIRLGKKVQELKLDEHYVITGYTKNINKGTATVTFQGIGEYGGTKTVKFKIGQRSISDYWNSVRSFFSSLIGG